MRKSKKDSSISVRFKPHFRRIAQGESDHCACVTGSDVTGSDITGNMFCACPAFSPALFLTIVVVQSVPLRMTDMATGCDVTGSDRLTSPEETS